MISATHDSVGWPVRNVNLVNLLGPVAIRSQVGHRMAGSAKFRLVVNIAAGARIDQDEFGLRGDQERVAGHPNRIREHTLLARPVLICSGAAVGNTRLIG
jgi:hypothetical protein